MFILPQHNSKIKYISSYSIKFMLLDEEKIGYCGGDPLDTIINLHMIGSRLREAREKRHLTQAEMAEKLEIHTIPMIILSGIPNGPA